MDWKIDGEPERAALGDYDGGGWNWAVVTDDSGVGRASVLVRFTGTVMSMGADALSERAAMGLESRGRTEVEAVLGWPEPPLEIEVHSDGVRRIGGDPGQEQRELSEVLDWLGQRGAVVFLIGRGGGSGDPATIRITKHRAHVFARGADSPLFSTEGASYLEAAQAAKAKWEEDKMGAYIELSTSNGTSNASLELTTPNVELQEKAQEAAAASDREFFVLGWQQLSSSGGTGKAVHLLEVINEDGDVLDIGAGDDVEDIILEAAPYLLPSWFKRPEGEQ